MEDQQAVRKLLAEAFGGRRAGNQGGLPGSELQLRSNPKGKRELTGKDEECSQQRAEEGMGGEPP